MRDWRIWCCRVGEEDAVEEALKQASAACVSPILSRRSVFLIHILSFWSVSSAEDKVSKCLLAVSNSPISTSSPATLNPRSANLCFHILNAVSSFSPLAF